MPEQETKYISINDLVLWTENPRDPVDISSSAQYIVERALTSRKGKWELVKLAKKMGKHYDQSEIPTVVYDKGKPIVYDGNRRMALAKIKHGLVKVQGITIVDIPSIPQNIPCNVCSKPVALENVLRKHQDSGSWDPLERDIFTYKHMNQEKSPFLLIDEFTNIISSNPHMNKRFVKEEIFNLSNLNKLGIEINNGKLKSRHSQEELNAILKDISEKIFKKEISTRENRNKLFQTLDPQTNIIITENRNKPLRDVNKSDVVIHNETLDTKPQKSTNRVKTRMKMRFFGETKSLQPGDVNNLYKDISWMFNSYSKRTPKNGGPSETFIALIRMSLRFICDVAGADKYRDSNPKAGLKEYLVDYSSLAFESLNKNEITSCSSHSVEKGSIDKLLQTSGHSYRSTLDYEQTIALSIVVGKMIELSHGRSSN